MKRFYKQVAVVQLDDGAGWQVTLDGRGIKTVRGAPQAVPSKALAEAMATEWAEQGEKLDTSKFVYRDMADYALDVVESTRGDVIDKLLNYGETDTLCYRADPEDALFARQQEVWEPLLQPLEKASDFTFTRVSGIVHKPQSEAALAALRARIEGQSAFALAGLEAMASLASSLITAILAGEPGADADSLWDAVCLEELWQADLWGRDEEAEERRAKRRTDFLAAHQFITLARG